MNSVDPLRLAPRFSGKQLKRSSKEQKQSRKSKTIIDHLNVFNIYHGSKGRKWFDFIFYYFRMLYWMGVKMLRKCVKNWFPKRLHGESAESYFTCRESNRWFYVILMETSIKSHLQNMCDCRSTADGVTMGK